MVTHLDFDFSQDLPNIWFKVEFIRFLDKKVCSSQTNQWCCFKAMPNLESHPGIYQCYIITEEIILNLPAMINAARAGNIYLYWYSFVCTSNFVCTLSFFSTVKMDVWNRVRSTSSLRVHGSFFNLILEAARSGVISRIRKFGNGQRPLICNPSEGGML